MLTSGVLPWLTFSAAFAAVLLALATFVRAGGWRQREVAEKTEIKITQVDQQARDNIDKVEREARDEMARFDAAMRSNLAAVYQDMHHADGDTRQSLSKLEGEFRNSMREQGGEISQIKENVRHLPTQQDLAKLNEGLAKIGAAQAGDSARIGGAIDLLTRMDRTLQRLEDHALALK